MLTVKTLSFQEFTIEQLYETLRLRTDVFVVEQDCVYQDIDNKDQKALHVIGYDGDEIAAYTRIFKPGDYFDEASIGRVLVSSNHRRKDYGKEIMKASILAIQEHFQTSKIRISAQCYLLRFYTELGFNQVGNEYIEDGIPHINMITA